MMKDTGEHSDERDAGQGIWDRAGSFHALSGHHSLNTSMCSPTYKLCELSTFGIFREPASRVSRYDVSLTPFLVPLPSLKNRR